jgi:hypothetical protein
MALISSRQLIWGTSDFSPFGKKGTRMTLQLGTELRVKALNNLRVDLFEFENPLSLMIRHELLGVFHIGKWNQLSSHRPQNVTADHES